MQALQRPWASRGHAAAALLLCGLLACRVYREDSVANDGKAHAGTLREAPSAPVADESRETPEGHARDALNLWVLNRPKQDLPSPSGASVAVTSKVGAGQRAAAVVALGVGPASPCAEIWAGRAVRELASGMAPAAVVAAWLDVIRRWRWPQDEGSSSGILAASDGRVGGIQAASAPIFSATELALALEQRAFFRGRRARVAHAVTPVARPRDPSCAEASDALDGPVGVLARSASGDFAGGIVSRDPPLDAGVVSIVAQYGVSVAVGAAGGVLLLSDCAVLPPERIAERIHASENWALASAELGPPGSCRSSNVLLTEQRAWASGGELAWAAVEEQPGPPPEATPRATMDAGTPALEPGSTP